MQVSKVLVVDGDGPVRDALVACLRFVGLEAHGADGALAARSWLRTGDADVMVLSDQLRDGAAAEFFGGVTGRERAAIVMVASGTSPPLSTNYPVDATLLRPITVGRVVEQVEWLIERRNLNDEVVQCEFSGLILEVNAALARRGGAEVHLGPTEARLLRFFMAYPDKVYSRAQLLRRLWPASVRVEERTVDVHIRRLRQSLTVLKCDDYVQTVRGSGYRFSALPV